MLRQGLENCFYFFFLTYFIGSDMLCFFLVINVLILSFGKKAKCPKYKCSLCFY